MSTRTVRAGTFPSARRRTFVFSVARRNLVINPSFEESILTGWEQYNGSTTRNSRDTSIYYIGQASLKLFDGPGNDFGQWARVDNLPAGTYTASCWMRTENVDNNAAFVVRRPLDFYAFPSQFHITGTTPWTRRVIVFSITETTTIDVLCGIGSYGSTSGGTAWFDAVTLESGDASSSGYFDGSYSTAGKQVRWTATANNSISEESS